MERLANECLSVRKRPHTEVRIKPALFIGPPTGGGNNGASNYGQQVHKVTK